MTTEPDGMDWFTLGEVLGPAFRAKEHPGVVMAVIESYAVARDLDAAELARVAFDHLERVRRIEQAETASAMLDEAEKNFAGER